MLSAEHVRSDAATGNTLSAHFRHDDSKRGQPQGSAGRFGSAGRTLARSLVDRHHLSEFEPGRKGNPDGTVPLVNQEHIPPDGRGKCLRNEI